MRFVQHSQLTKIMEQEGTRNIEDILDLNENREERKTPQNIKILIENSQTSEKKQDCLEKTKSFCTELTTEFENTFLFLLNEYSNNRREIPASIKHYIEEKNFNLPSFLIADAEASKDILTGFNFFDSYIKKENLLLVFQLPKPLAQFWWKGGAYSWGDNSVDIQDTAIEWGHFYRELMPVVWENQGYYENEIGLNFYRINDIGQHSPNNYYYIWEVESVETEGNE